MMGLLGTLIYQVTCDMVLCCLQVNTVHEEHIIVIPCSRNLLGLQAAVQSQCCPCGLPYMFRPPFLDPTEADHTSLSVSGI
jgi:hypothetical protein